MGQQTHMLTSPIYENYSENSDEDICVFPLRLKGGGESSLTNGSSAWGTPPSQPPNNSNGKMTTNASQQSSSDNVVWGQVGSKTQTNNSIPPPNPTAGSPVTTPYTNGPSSTTKQQLEQLQTLREAIFSQDGWGVQYVNQDTNWDIPSSPEPPLKTDGSSGSAPWKPPVNNGTELWEANLRNGGQPALPQQKTPWGHTPSNNIGGTWGEDDDVDSSNVWTGGNPNQQQWAGNGNANNGAMWNGSKKEEEWSASTNNNWRDPRASDHRPVGTDSRDLRPGMRGANNSETIRLLDHRESMKQMPSEMRGDPRGITGRLNGAGAESFWGQSSHVAPQSLPHHKMQGSANGTGWEEGPPPPQKRSGSNYDDGTSLWGSHWKDLPTTGNMGRNSVVAGPLGMTQARMKPENSAWGNSRNGSWDEMGTQPVTWDEPNSWMKQKMSNPSWENDLDWGQKLNKIHLTKEIIWNSKQFRILVDMGHKKEDVENALRVREMNMDEASDLLNTLRRVENWGNRHDEHYESVALGNQKFSLGPNVPLSNFPPSNNDPNYGNVISNSINTNNSLLNNVSSAYVQKMMLQGGGPQGLGSNHPPIAIRNLQSQPSAQQLKLLVGQIQMAVQAGFLNNQILNQPLAPQTLALLNQLLQQIKTLQQLIAQQSILSTYTVNGKPNNAFMQYSVLIAKTKQAIANIQNQISTQQATYVKQQMGDVMKPTMMHESINALQNNFSDIGINKEHPTNQQSKLNQWINKDKEGNEFSRAPGSTSKLAANTPFGITPAEGPWSSGRSGDTGWPEGTGDAAIEKDTQWSGASQSSITDLVPEFEPGKPWKGNQLKSIEDDPTITPGSVVRSTLSIPTIKDAKLMNMNPSKSPPATDTMQSFGLNSSTWSHNPPIPTSSTFTSPPGKLPTSSGGLTESNATPTISSDLWAAPKQSKGPPGFSSDNNWSNNINHSSSWVASQRNSGNWGGSTWLLLRNLTAQIDGSTLRTLCMQHGPLMSFNLYLYHGFALAKYSSREEATKAQIALNNCVLGNTTILAENPTDWDANTLLQQLASQQNGSSGNWRGSSKQTSTESWNAGWANNTSSANLWSAPSLDCSDPRGTPSNMNSYLPNDLLGGESI